MGNIDKKQKINTVEKTNFILINYQVPSKKERPNYELIIQPTSLRKRKKKPNKWRYISIFLAALALFVSLGSQFYYKKEAEKTNEQIAIVKEELEKKQQEKKRIADTTQKNSQSSIEFTYQPKETFLDDSDDEVYLGQVSIPEVHLQLPVVKGVGEKIFIEGQLLIKLDS